jgi:hypothetical protein
MRVEHNGCLCDFSEFAKDFFEVAIADFGGEPCDVEIVAWVGSTVGTSTTTTTTTTTASTSSATSSTSARR